MAEKSPRDLTTVNSTFGHATCHLLDSSSMSFSYAESDFAGWRMSVSVYSDCSPEMFRATVEPRREPAVLRGLNLGPCTAEWSTATAFANRFQPLTVRVHVTSQENMSFTAKNFQYSDMDIKELVKRASKVVQDKFFVSEEELYYLRSVTADARMVQVSQLHTDFPELAEDFVLPKLFEPDRFFSSVLRISSGRVRVWTHYDVMDNAYCQIVGHKKAVLWPPHEASRLYLDGENKSLYLHKVLRSRSRSEPVLFGRSRNRCE